MDTGGLDRGMLINYRNRCLPGIEGSLSRDNAFLRSFVPTIIVITLSYTVYIHRYYGRARFPLQRSLFILSVPPFFSPIYEWKISAARKISS